MLLTRALTFDSPVTVNQRGRSCCLSSLMVGHVWMPNGFGMVSSDGMGQGANQNELTDVADGDPFTGIPHHRHVRCQVKCVLA
jgi:hypothetical protein